MITLQKEPVKACLDIIADSVKVTSASMPILSHVKIEYADGLLTMSYTNLDQSVQVTQKIEGGKDFAIVVPLSTFRQLVSNSPAMEFTIEPSGNRSKFKAGSFNAVIPIWSEISEFPTIPEVSVEAIELDYAKLIPAINTAMQSASDDQTRYVMNGVYIHSSGEESIKLASTDGRWLTVEEIPCKNDGKISCIVPTSTIKAIAGKDIGRIYAHLQPRIISFSYHAADDITVVIHSKLVEGTFPNYNQVIPKSKRKYASINAVRLENVLKRLKVMAKIGKVESQHLKIEIEGKSAKFSVANSEQSAWEPVDIEGDHDNVTCALNIHYLMDTVNALKSSETINASFSDLDPTMVNVDDRKLTRIIMPIRLN